MTFTTKTNAVSQYFLLRLCGPSPRISSTFGCHEFVLWQWLVQINSTEVTHSQADWMHCVWCSNCHASSEWTSSQKNQKKILINNKKTCDSIGYRDIHYSVNPSYKMRPQQQRKWWFRAFWIENIENWESHPFMVQKLCHTTSVFTRLYHFAFNNFDFSSSTTALSSLSLSVCLFVFFRLSTTNTSMHIYSSFFSDFVFSFMTFIPSANL